MYIVGGVVDVDTAVDTAVDVDGDVNGDVDVDVDTDVAVAVEVDVDGLLLELEQGKLLAISQGAPPPIKGMARASVNQPTTDNNGGMAQPASKNLTFFREPAKYY